MAAEISLSVWSTYGSVDACGFIHSYVFTGTQYGSKINKEATVTCQVGGLTHTSPCLLRGDGT